MLKKTLLSLVLLMAVAGAASAEIYKCVDADGVVKFSDRPCGRQAEVVVGKTDLSVDEAIGNGSPYPGPVKDSAVMNQDIMVHAKTVGASIIEGLYLESNDMGEDFKGRTRTWKVFLAYLDSKDEYSYAKMELNYAGEHVGDRIFVRLQDIRIQRARWIRLPALKKSKKLEQTSHFRWKVLP